jgi:phosphoserine phosphatase
MNKNFPSTIFVDLDGVLIQHCGPDTWFGDFIVLPGAHEALKRWWEAGCKIIIVTGRPSCLRQHVEDELRRHGLYYHQLIMDAGSGTRYVINDMKPYAPKVPTAVAVNVERNVGLNKYTEI